MALLADAVLFEFLSNKCFVLITRGQKGMGFGGIHILKEVR